MHNLTVKNLAKAYKSKKVITDVSLEIKQGEIIGLLGPNGAGKTTCFYMILGIIPCDAGQIFLNDLDLTCKPIHVRAKYGIGYLPQEPSVFRKLSVNDNIMAILQARKNLQKTEQTEILEKLLTEFH